MAKDITLYSPDGSELYYPKTVSDLVYNNDNGYTVKEELEFINYPLFEKSNSVNRNRFRNNGYLDSFKDIRLYFTPESDYKYFIYLGDFIKSTGINESGTCRILKQKSGEEMTTLFIFTPDTNTPFSKREYKSGKSVIILDLSKLDITKDFSLSMNSGVNLSEKCFYDEIDTSIEKEIEYLKYPMFEESDYRIQHLIDSGYIDAIKEVELYFNKDSVDDKYFIFLNIFKNGAVNESATISLYKNNSQLYNIQPDTNTPFHRRVYKNQYGKVIIDLSKLDATGAFTINTASGFNLSDACFGKENKKENIKYISNLINGGNTDYTELLKNFIKEIYIYDTSKILNNDITSVGINLIARNNSTFGWLIWFKGTDINGTNIQSFIQAKTGGKSFNESTEIIELQYNSANGSTTCGYIIVDWSVIEDGININTQFMAYLSEETLNIQNSPILYDYLKRNEIYNDITELENNIANVSNSLNYVETTLTESEIIPQYINSVGSITNGGSGYGSFVYDVTGMKGNLYVKSPVKNNQNVCVCRVEDASGNRLNTLVNTLNDATSEQTILLDGSAVKCYVSITMKNNVANSTAVAKLITSTVINLDVDLDRLNDAVFGESGVKYEIVVPDKIYAVVDDNLQIYYDSIFNVQNLNNYQIQTICSKGKDYPRYFEYKPTTSDVGTTTLTFKLSDVNDVTSGKTKLLVSKTVELITVPKVTTESANVLCVGDSTTTGGSWCKELARRFYSTNGTPTGVGATNINICGRKTATVSGKLCGWEGTGGWTWGTYVSSPVDAIRFTVKDVSSLTMGGNYVASNGVIFEITEINVTNGVGNVRCMYSWDTPNKNEIPANGTLTKRYSTTTGDNTITYTAFESEKFSPFYVNGEVDFTEYANKYCNGKIDIVVVHLGINSMFGLKENLPTHLTNIMNTAKLFLDKYHEQYPNGKVVLLTPPKCSLNGGMAANYNATQTATEEIYNRQMLQYHKAYFDLVKEDGYKDWVVVANTSGEFDTPFGYPTTDKAVNNRVSITEKVGTNGVHPDANGYNMIADNVYRIVTGIL